MEFTIIKPENSDVLRLQVTTNTNIAAFVIDDVKRTAANLIQVAYALESIVKLTRPVDSSNTEEPVDSPVTQPENTENEILLRNLLNTAIADLTWIALRKVRPVSAEVADFAQDSVYRLVQRVEEAQL